MNIKSEFAVKLMKGHVTGKVYLTDEGKKTLEKWAGVEHGKKDKVGSI